MEIIVMTFGVLLMFAFIGSLIVCGVWLLSFITKPKETVEETKWFIKGIIDNWKLFLKKDE